MTASFFCICVACKAVNFPAFELSDCASFFARVLPVNARVSIGTHMNCSSSLVYAINFDGFFECRLTVKDHCLNSADILEDRRKA